MNVNTFEMANECLKVYNPEKQELLGIYSTYNQAEKATGLSSKMLRDAIRTKKRKYSPFLKMEVAVRLAAREKTQL